MATVTITSGMNHFRLIDAIHRADREALAGEVRFHRAPAFACLEAAAQMAALHVRYRSDFTRHAFLLKILHFQGIPGGMCQGPYAVQARLVSHSRDAFRYAVAVEKKGQGKCADGELLIGSKDYDDRFQGGILERHYQGIFDRLMQLQPV